MAHAGRARRQVGTRALLLAGLLAGVLPMPAAANEVARWNDTVLKFSGANGQNAIQITRTLTMAHLAAHDAVNAIQRRYRAYYFEGPAEAGASTDAAVAAAMHTVLAGVASAHGSAAQQAAALSLAEQAYTAALARVAAGPAKVGGVAVGRAAGAAMLVLRHDDGARRDTPYTPGTGAGRWRPHANPTPANPPIANPDLARGYSASVLPNWGNVTPFTLVSASQYWLPGPPALSSATYARDFDEVKNLGGRVSTARTAEQTEIARFWFQGPPAWNLIAATVAGTRSLDLHDSARLFALMNAAMADAYIAGFKIRYVYDFWRPVTAIREGDTDGNDATAGDPAWDSHQNTPAVSDYPSTQSTFSAAAAAVLAVVLGTDQMAFSFTSAPPFAGITRSFTSFSGAARESADSRVYAGIHFRSACEDGLTLGRRVAERATAMYLLPVRR